MQDRDRKFHEFALQSILFKGRPDWYFCYLKTERITHVLALLAAGSDRGAQDDFDELLHRAAALPGEVAHLAAGEMDVSLLLADIFGLMATLRLLGVRQVIRTEHVNLLVKEYEQVVERLTRGSHPSPFLSTEDLQVALPEPHSPTPLPLRGQTAIKDMSQTEDKGQSYKGHSDKQSDRMTTILDLVRKRKSLSIKDIAAVITDCSEKTIQRELNLLIERGLIRREGERRWSVYRPI